LAGSWYSFCRNQLKIGGQHSHKRTTTRECGGGRHGWKRDTGRGSLKQGGTQEHYIAKPPSYEDKSCEGSESSELSDSSVLEPVGNVGTTDRSLVRR
jgi:hypothetical protein